MKANTCPYCGGAYTLTLSCSGPRTEDPAENTCPSMRRHREDVLAAVEMEEIDEMPEHVGEIK